ncbi:hypothetical protein MRX96_021805 [Rhipicephalus microplus]
MRYASGRNEPHTSPPSKLDLRTTFPEMPRLSSLRVFERTGLRDYPDEYENSARRRKHGKLHLVRDSLKAYLLLGRCACPRAVSECLCYFVIQLVADFSASDFSSLLMLASRVRVEARATTT